MTGGLLQVVTLPHTLAGRSSDLLNSHRVVLVEIGLLANCENGPEEGEREGGCKGGWGWVGGGCRGRRCRIGEGRGKGGGQILCWFKITQKVRNEHLVFKSN